MQIAMPVGGEPQAVAFYADVLGLAKVAKPEALAGRGGAWFEVGTVRVNLGVETPFRPARRSHPANLPGIARIFTEDPFGNRIELLERL